VVRRAASRVLTAGQVRDLLAAAPPPDPEVSGAALARAYRLDDGGTLLVFEDGKGRRYESREALLAMMAAVAAQVPVSPLASRLPADFVAQAPALADSLGLAQLSDVDTFIASAGVSQCLRAPLFGQLVAYVGEFIRGQAGGAWHTELAADGATLEPWIVDPSGRRHAPFALVLSELSEWGSESSLAGAVVGHLQSRRLL